MCGVCNDTAEISGRVDHVRWTNVARRYSAATNGNRVECYIEGDRIPCPYCRADMYGTISRVTIRKDMSTMLDSPRTASAQRLTPP